MDRQIYKLTLTTLGPVHIGDGIKARTKEYLLLNNGCTIYFPNMGDLYISLNDAQKQDFENYLIGSENYKDRNNRNLKLGEWLKKQLISKTGDWAGYCLNNGNVGATNQETARHQSAFADDNKCRYVHAGGRRCGNHARGGLPFCGIHAGAQVTAEVAPEASMAGQQIFLPDQNDRRNQTHRLNDISACMKDVYNKPYVPGSSLKGLLRTLFVVWKQERAITAINPYTPTQSKEQRSAYETRVTNPEVTLVSKDSLPTDDKDIFQFLSVSDSMPLDSDDLVLCKKIDRLNKQKSTKHGPTWESTPALDRECIRPGVAIEFVVTCDDESLQDFLASIGAVISKYNERSIVSIKEKFNGWGSGNVQNWQEQGVYIGGGTGFHTKTIAMSNIVRANILDWKFDKTGGATKHSRANGGDSFRRYVGPFAKPLENLGTSDTYGWPSTFVDSVNGELQSSAPRVYKLTKIGNDYYEMGKCRISIEAKD